MKNYMLSLWLFLFAASLTAQEIDVTGKNISIPSGSATYTPKRNTFFGYQVSSQGSITKTFTIKNYGTANLTVGTVTATGDFTVATQPTSPVAPGGFTTFTVTFDPNSITTLNGTITIPNNDANESTYTFGVQGVGLNQATQRQVRWVHNGVLSRPATVVLQGVTYNVIPTTYTTVQTAINAANQYDIVYITDGRYFNAREAVSTNCSITGLNQDLALYDSVQYKNNIIITSSTGDYNTSNARLVGYGFDLKGGNDITIQGLRIDSCRVNAFWNSNCCGWDPTTDVKILNNFIMRTGGHGIKTDYWGNGLGSVIDRGAWEINGNRFENIGFYAGYFGTCPASPVSAMWLGEAGGCFEIDRNTIVNVKWAAILCNGYGDAYTSANGAVTISNNTINVTVNAGIQLGWNFGGNGYPAEYRNSYVTGNYIQNANTSNAAGIGAITVLISYVGNTNILRNHITSSYNGVAINIAGWNNSMAADTSRIQYNNFCGLTAGSSAITHIGGQNGNGFWGTPDNLGKYKCDNNYYGSASGPTYYLNPGGIGWQLKEEATFLVAGPATYSQGDFNFLPYRTIPYPNPLVPACQCEPNTSNTVVTACVNYLWNSVNYTTSGTYSHSMPNAGVGGCDSVAYLVLTISNPTTTALSQTNLTCFGGSNGAASVNAATGGIAPYSYNWTPGNPTGDGTTSVTGLTAGTWTCTATDAAGCIATRTFSITSPSAIVVTPASQTNISCFGGTNGAASINTPTGGAGGYTYNWTPGNPTGDGTVSVTGLAAGTWTCTVTDVNACAATQTFNITAPSALVVTPASQTNISCNGGSNGAASINTPTGGAGGYTYNWTPGNPTGDGTVSVTGLTTGTWTCTVTDANSCVATQTFNITAPSAIVVTPASQTNSSCFGGSNGAASINTPTGGAGGYTYNWTPGNPTGDGTISVTGLTAGSWTCTVTDANSCVATQTFNITAPSAIVVTAASQTNISCFGGSNGAASINTPTGGAGGYTYNWTPGNPTGDGTVSVTGLTAGTWTCTVTDANSCVATQTFNVTAPSALVASAASQTNNSCFGGSNGAASVSVTGGTVAYSYNWTPGNPTGDGTTSVTGLTAGTWTCTVTDANSCVTTQTFNITAPSALVATPVSQTNISCFGGSNGAASVSVTGGTVAYSYNWTPGNPTGDGTASVTGLTAGTWTCTVTDANSCVATQTFNITAPSALVVTPASQTNISCNGGSNGAASVSVSGGTTSYSYNWTPGNPTGDGTTSVTGLTAGTWTCTVTDANSCVTTQTFNITAPSALVVTPVSQSNISCFGGANGAASVSVTGGTVAYSYNWTPGNPTGDGTASVTGLTSGTWTCTVTDANSCVTTQTFNITAPSALVATPVSQTNISCNGGSNGAASVTVSGGTTTYSYNWTPGNPTGDGTASVTGLTAGTWTCTVTDANSCVTTQTFNITAPSALVATPVSQTNISCNGGSNGAASVSVSGGTTSYSYNWTPGNPTGDGTASVTGLTAGTWTCTVTDANSCVTTQTFNITAPSALVVSAASQTNVSCFGGSNGAASVTVTGGTTSYSYNWTPGNPTGDGTASVTGLTAGTWTCTVTDANSCVTTQTFNITAPPALTATSSATSISCNGGNATVTVVGAGGTAPYTGEGSFTVTAGTYTYTVTDANGCTVTTSITITEPTALTAAATGTSILCNGGNATVTVVGAGGTAPYTGEGSFTVTAGTYSYTVTDANGCTVTTSITITEPTALTAAATATSILCNGGNATVTVVGAGGTAPYTGEGSFTVTAGTYSYTVTDANGCTVTTSITITEPTALTAAATATSILCNGGNATVTVVGAGGTAPYTGEGSFTELAGTHSYTVTDANGCTVTTSITITEPSAISTTVVSVNVGCNGDSTGSIDLTVTGGTGPYTFDWNSGTYTTEDLTGLGAGTYIGVLTDANGCTDGGTIVISEPAVLVASVTTTVDPDSCGALNGSIDITVSGGTIGYTFLWNTTATTEDLTGVGAGAYSCVVTDTNGCTANVSGNLNDPNAPTVTLTIANDTVCIDDGAFVLAGESPIGGTFSGPGVTAGSFDPTAAGVGVHMISYTFVDVNGCSGSTTDSIYVDVCTDIQFPVSGSAFSVYPNPNDGTFVLQTTSVADVMIYDAQGKLVYTQKVQANVATQINIVESGMYLITVTNANGERTSQRVMVTK